LSNVGRHSAQTLQDGLAACVLWPSGPPRSEVPTEIQAQLNVRAAQVAVQMQADWCVSWATSFELRCKANVFGMDPQNATAVA
jgi:hypothetical protein